MTRRDAEANLQAMEIDELDANERTALVGLVKATLLSDGRVSEEEEEELAHIIDALGEQAYRQGLDSFEARFADEDSFKQFLATITRQEARDVIYGTILDAAAPDVMDDHDSELLAWLAEAWNIEVTVQDPQT